MRKSVKVRRRRKWRPRTKLFVLSTLLFVSALIYWEQAALLYVASTVLICVVLLAVAFADLEGKDAQLSEAAEVIDAAEVRKPAA